MENITIGQISSIILYLVSFIGGIVTLIIYIKKGLKSAFKEDFNDIKTDIQLFKNDLTEEIKSVKDDLKEIGISDCKNFLVNCYAKIEAGQELDETEKERYGEMYDLYTKKYKQNSYIHSKHEKLLKEGKL